MMEDWKHILDRQFIHFFSAQGIYSLSLIGFHYLNKFTPFKTKGLVRLILPALLILLVASWREPADVARGGWVVKSYLDIYAGWALGLAVGVWATRWSDRHISY